MSKHKTFAVIIGFALCCIAWVICCGINLESVSSLAWHVVWFGFGFNPVLPAMYLAAIAVTFFAAAITSIILAGIGA